MTIAVVDAGGHLILLERMEGGKFHTVHSATTKAACAASTRRVTTSHGAVGQALDTAHALGLALAAGPERWTAMEGGCPVLVNGECIGGVGVAGADWRDGRNAGAGSGHGDRRDVGMSAAPTRTNAPWCEAFAGR